MSTKFDIGGRLQAERRRLGLRQEDFAQAQGVSRATQANYEAGLRMPDAEYLQSIAAAGVDVLYVVTGVRQPLRVEEPRAGYNVSAAAEESRREQALLDNYRGADDEGRRLIEGVAHRAAQPAATAAVDRRKTAG